MGDASESNPLDRPDDHWLNAREVAEVCGCSVKTVRKWFHGGALAGQRLGSEDMLHFRVEDVKRLLRGIRGHDDGQAKDGLPERPDDRALDSGGDG